MLVENISNAILSHELDCIVIDGHEEELIFAIKDKSLPLSNTQTEGRNHSRCGSSDT